MIWTNFLSQLNYLLIYLSSVYETESLPPPSLTISCCFLLHFVTTERLKQAKDWRPADHQKLFRCPDCSCFTPYKKFPTHLVRFLIHSFFVWENTVISLLRSLYLFFSLSAIHKQVCPLRDPPTTIIPVLVCHQVRITSKRYVNQSTRH